MSDEFDVKIASWSTLYNYLISKCTFDQTWVARRQGNEGEANNYLPLMENLCIIYWLFFTEFIFWVFSLVDRSVCVIWLCYMNSTCSCIWFYLGLLKSDVQAIMMSELSFILLDHQRNLWPNISCGGIRQQRCGGQL